MIESKLGEYQSTIRRKLGERLEYCGGNVVVLFDELQKITPGTLDGMARERETDNTHKERQREITAAVLLLDGVCNKKVFWFWV